MYLPPKNGPICTSRQRLKGPIYLPPGKGPIYTSRQRTALYTCRPKERPYKIIYLLPMNAPIYTCRYRTALCTSRHRTALLVYTSRQRKTLYTSRQRTALYIPAAIDRPYIPPAKERLHIPAAIERSYEYTSRHRTAFSYLPPIYLLAKNGPIYTCRLRTALYTSRHRTALHTCCPKTAIYLPPLYLPRQRTALYTSRHTTARMPENTHTTNIPAAKERPYMIPPAIQPPMIMPENDPTRYIVLPHSVAAKRGRSIRGGSLLTQSRSKAKVQVGRSPTEFVCTCRLGVKGWQCRRGITDKGGGGESWHSLRGNKSPASVSVLAP